MEIFFLNLIFDCLKSKTNFSEQTIFRFCWKKFSIFFLYKKFILIFQLTKNHVREIQNVYKLCELSKSTNQYSQLFIVTVCDGIQSLLLVQKENPTICMFSLHSNELDWTPSRTQFVWRQLLYTPDRKNSAPHCTWPVIVLVMIWLCLWYVYACLFRFFVVFIVQFLLYTYCDYFHLYIISMIVSEYDFWHGDNFSSENCFSIII